MEAQRKVEITEGDITIAMYGVSHTDKSIPEVLEIMKGILHAWGYVFDGDLEVVEND
jgi:hypothetical protein